MALEAVIKKAGLHRVVLEEYPEGVYVLVFETEDSQWPCQDHLQDNWEIAKLQGREDFGIPENGWVEIPDTHVMDQP